MSSIGTVPYDNHCLFPLRKVKMEERRDEKMIELESRMMYLEDSLQQMSLQMMKKDRVIEILQEKLSTLEEKLRELDERKMNRGGADVADERPPHY